MHKAMDAELFLAIFGFHRKKDQLSKKVSLLKKTFFVKRWKKTTSIVYIIEIWQNVIAINIKKYCVCFGFFSRNKKRVHSVSY